MMACMIRPARESPPPFRRPRPPIQRPAREANPEITAGQRRNKTGANLQPKRGAPGGCTQALKMIVFVRLASVFIINAPPRVRFWGLAGRFDFVVFRGAVSGRAWRRGNHRTHERAGVACIFRTRPERVLAFQPFICDCRGGVWAVQRHKLRYRI